MASSSIVDCVWEVEVDRSTAANWAGMLDLFDDANLYQTWSYGKVRWGEKNLSHVVLRRGGEVLAMAQLRIVRPMRLNFGIAYLRWGPLFERRGRPIDPEVPAYMARVLHEEYVINRRLALRVVPNAFAGSQRGRLFQAAFAGFDAQALTTVDTYRTFVLSLAPPVEELRRNFDRKWRNMLTQSERKPLRVTAGNGADEYRTFCRMYYEMKRRKTFQSTVDVEEFGRIQEDLPEPHRMMIWTCEDKGLPVAGLAVSAMGDTAIYILGATSDTGLNSKGAYLLQWTAVQWLKKNGLKWYDLGGIDPEKNPGVYRFKRGLSGADVLQINPFVACDNIASSAIIRIGLALRRVLWRCRGALHSVWSPHPQVSGG